MVVISVINRKGGVAKTTSAVNLAAIYGKEGYKVLVIDVDSQMNATSYLNMYRIKENTSYELLCDVNTPITDTIRKTEICNIDICPGGLNLDKAYEKLLFMGSREYILKKKLWAIKDKYDFVFIDCPAARDIITTNALTASDYAILPCEPNELGVDSLVLMYEFAEEVKSSFNLDLRIAGIFFVKKGSRSVIHREYSRILREDFDRFNYFNSSVRSASAVEKSHYAHKPLILNAPNEPVTQDYIAVSKELLEIIKNGGNHNGI
ncbi:MAG: ParA family protein [Ruminococcus sp.]|nr:ParA family protein [Ruminococcus sp.]